MNLRSTVTFISTVSSLICCIYTSELNSNDNEPIKLLVDTDAGGDDAVALSLALKAKELDVVAITCTYGNTDEKNVEVNVLKILTIANRTDIPVYMGAEKPLLKNYTAGNYFGYDGLGDFEFDRKIEGSINRSLHAALAMIQLAKDHSGKLSVLTLGPLTNVALAASLDPTFIQNIERLYVMGSQVIEDDGDSEFNFSLDPESNAVVLQSSTKLKILIAPYNVAMKSALPKRWRTEVLGSLKSETINFLNKVESYVMNNTEVWVSADTITVAVIAWPNMINSSIEAQMVPIVCGPKEGTVQVYPKEVNKNVEIVREIDIEFYKEKLMQHFM